MRRTTSTQLVIIVGCTTSKYHNQPKKIGRWFCIFNHACFVQPILSLASEKGNAPSRPTHHKRFLDCEKTLRKSDIFLYADVLSLVLRKRVIFLWFVRKRVPPPERKGSPAKESVSYSNNCTRETWKRRLTLSNIRENESLCLSHSLFFPVSNPQRVFPNIIFPSVQSLLSSDSPSFLLSSILGIDSTHFSDTRRESYGTYFQDFTKFFTIQVGLRKKIKKTILRRNCFPRQLRLLELFLEIGNTRKCVRCSIVIEGCCRIAPSTLFTARESLISFNSLKRKPSIQFVNVRLSYTIIHF